MLKLIPYVYRDSQLSSALLPQSTLFASELNVAGVSTFVGNGNFINDLTVGGNLNVTGDIVYDEVTGRNINITGISTFEGNTIIGRVEQSSSLMLTFGWY